MAIVEGIISIIIAFSFGLAGYLLAKKRYKLDETRSLSVRVNSTRDKKCQLAQFRLHNNSKRPINIESWCYSHEKGMCVSIFIRSWGIACTSKPDKPTLPVVLKEQETIDFLVELDESKCPLEKIERFGVTDVNHNRYWVSEDNVKAFVKTAITVRDNLCPNDMEPLIHGGDKESCPKCGYYKTGFPIPM